GEIPVSQSRAHRFDSFTRDVLPAANEAIKGNALGEAAEAIAAGERFAGLDFSVLTTARREEAGSTLDRWREIFRRIPSSKDDVGFAARVGDFLESLGMGASILEVSGMTNPHAKRFVGDFRLD